MPGMGAFGLQECKSLILRVKVPYGQGWRLEPLASRKGVAGNRKSEGSETAKPGPDEQEPYKRCSELDEQAHHCDVQNIESW